MTTLQTAKAETTGAKRLWRVELWLLRCIVYGSLAALAWAHWPEIIRFFK